MCFVVPTDQTFCNYLHEMLVHKRACTRVESSDFLSHIKVEHTLLHVFCVFPIAEIWERFFLAGISKYFYTKCAFITWCRSQEDRVPSKIVIHGKVPATIELGVQSAISNWFARCVNGFNTFSSCPTRFLSCFYFHDCLVEIFHFECRYFLGK